MPEEQIQQNAAVLDSLENRARALYRDAVAELKKQSQEFGRPFNDLENAVTRIGEAAFWLKQSKGK